MTNLDMIACFIGYLMILLSILFIIGYVVFHVLCFIGKVNEYNKREDK